MTGYAIPLSVARAARSPLRRPRRDFAVTSGDDFTLELTVYDSDAAAEPTNVSDAGVTLSIIDEASGEVLTEVGGTVYSAVDGRLNIPVAAADTTDLQGRYRHTIHLDLGSGITALAAGFVNIAPGSDTVVSDYVLPDDGDEVYMPDVDDHGTVTSGAIEIDATAARAHTLILGAADTEITMATFSRPNRLVSVLIMATQDDTGIRTITWPDSFRWQGGFSPSLSTAAGATDVIQALTTDSGATWIASIAYQVAAPE